MRNRSKSHWVNVMYFTKQILNLIGRARRNRRLANNPAREKESQVNH
jgi:hypothetical protein